MGKILREDWVVNVMGGKEVELTPLFGIISEQSLVQK